MIHKSRIVIYVIGQALLSFLSLGRHCHFIAAVINFHFQANF